MFKRTIAALTVLVAMLCFAVKVDAADGYTKDDTLLIYWYICGTDLEEDGGMATNKISQLQEVSLPPNVKVLLYANGSVNWQHAWIDKRGPGIYSYDSTGSLDKLASWKADMGKPDTLKKFLKFGEENFKPDRRIIIFWDHGGVNGLCYDKAFDLGDKPEFGGHNLTFQDLHKVFESVYGHSDEKPFELVGFDTCLSASYELANSIADFSRYMVGSEPSEYGWNYKDWLTVLAADPRMNGAAIGQAVCDATMQNYSDGSFIKSTSAFSVINLSKMPEVRKAFGKYFGEANSNFDKQKGFGGAFARTASSGITEKYSDLYMDLGTLAENTKDIMPEASERLLNAIGNAVVYNNVGEYMRGHGLSTYYPYVSTNNFTVSTVDFKNFLTQKFTPGAQKNFYKKLLKLDTSNLQATPVELDVNYNVVANLTTEQLDNVSRACCLIIPYVEDGDESVGLQDEGAVILSSDVDLNVDWTTGTFTENFLGVWPAIDGHRITMYLTSEGASRNAYSVPILLSYDEFGTDDNGQPVLVKHHENEPVILQVIFDVATNQYQIYGVSSDVENGMVRNLENIELKPGNIITPRFLTFVAEDSLDADDGNVTKITDPNTGKSICYKVSFGEPFTYSGNGFVEHVPFKDGQYAYFFQFNAPNGTATLSWPAIITLENGNVTKIIPELKDLTAAE